MTTQPKYTQLSPDELKYFERRDIRESAVEELKEVIESRGYDDGRPMKVVPNGKGYLVADGNHRLKAVEENGIDRTLPCLVYEDGDPVEIGLESNRGEDVYAEEDLFDTLDTIQRLQNKGLTQSEIADVYDDGQEVWSESKVRNYVRVSKEIRTEVLDIARNHQEGRVRSNRTDVRFNFTEGWFRNSGLYDLNRDNGHVMYAEDGDIVPAHAQERVMWWFCYENNCKVSKSQVSNQCEKVAETLDMLDMIDDQLEAGVSDEKRKELQQAAISGSHGIGTLPNAIEAANEDAQDRAIYGKCATEALQDVGSNEVGCVVTDPPYGVEYTSHRETGRGNFPDGHEETLLLLDDVFQELKRVCKENAHIYIFAPWNTGIPELASEYFEVADMPLIWTKNNHVPTRDRQNGFDRMYAPKYQMIWVCRMPKGNERKLRPPGEVNDNVFNYPRPTETWHDTQKPVALLKDLVTNSTGEGETVLDPFAGSGSTLIAAAETNRHYIGIEKDTDYEDRLTREIREVKQ